MYQKKHLVYLKDKIKADMTTKGVDEIETGDRIVRWKEVTSLNLDSTKLKKALPDVYKLYAYERTTKQILSITKRLPAGRRYCFIS